MFNGEFESLKAIEETQTIKVPHPILLCVGSLYEYHEYLK